MNKVSSGNYVFSEQDAKVAQATLRYLSHLHHTNYPWEAAYIFEDDDIRSIGIDGKVDILDLVVFIKQQIEGI